MKEFIYLDEGMGEDGGCEAAVTARTRCGWINIRVCGEFLYENGFLLKLKKRDF